MRVFNELPARKESFKEEPKVATKAPETKRPEVELRGLTPRKTSEGDINKQFVIVNKHESKLIPDTFLSTISQLHNGKKKIKFNKILPIHKLRIIRQLLSGKN
jgi:hypothetical protein